MISFDEPQKTERFLLMYTRPDAVGQRGRADVTVTGVGSTTAAVQGAVAGAIASMLMHVERSTEGSVEVETRPTKK